MTTEHIPQPVHDRDDSSPAPGELELVRSALSLHDHEPGSAVSLPPSKASIEWWLRSRGLIGKDESASSNDLAWTKRVLDALRATLPDGERAADAQRILNRAAAKAGLQVCFGCGRDDRFHTEAAGVSGAVGRLLGIAFLAQLSGEWDRLRECSSPTCTSVFYDRSKNRSGKWCSMQSCGNRNKVRNFRERAKATTA